MMKRLLATVSVLPGAPWPRPIFFCLELDGRVDFATTCTLLELVTLCVPDYPEFEDLIRSPQYGQYYVEVNLKRPKPSWSIGGLNVWLTPPMAKPRCIGISNENIPAYSSRKGPPRQFTSLQFWAAVRHWRGFTELLATEGDESFIGRYYETLFP